MSRLEGGYQVVYKGTEGRCGHEFIIDIRPFKVNLQKTCKISIIFLLKNSQHLNITAKDVVKRL
jgi:glycine cleavage system protein P-like pyridoxal-binding family